MARAGLCSRREAEQWITDGRVRINGSVLQSAAVPVAENDIVEIDGKPLPQKEKTRLFMFHKPAGLLTASKDDRGRATVFDALPEGLPRLISVGRLDLNSEGLLLLTNDGALSRHLELPGTGLTRTYSVRVFGTLDEAALDNLKNGIEVEGVRYGAIDIRIKPGKGRNHWLEVSLQEGKNREIRKVMAALDLSVNRLIRTSFGPFKLGSIKPNDVVEIAYSRFERFIPCA